jgi:3-phosphoshikimate 1-carboxyvinyltransferase
MQQLRIEPISCPFDVEFTPPGSKSLTNRAMVLAALSSGPCRLDNALFADDTRVMIDGLQRLGFDVQADEAAKAITIRGEGGRIPAPKASLFCGNSGTTIRFLTALCAAAGRGRYMLDGVPRMRQRPIGALVAMLRNLAGRIQFDAAEGYPPLTLDSKGLAGGLARYGSEVSSQYLSAVLQVAPYARSEVQIDLEGPQTSWPYVAMTTRLMHEFHVTSELETDRITGEPRRLIVPNGVYRREQFAIEPDASNATYFLALAAIHEGAKVTINGLGKGSLQGDVGFADVLHDMGASLIFGRDFLTIQGTGELRGVDVDLGGMPDTAQTLAVAALFAEGPTTIRGLHTLRVKETDRLAALQTELSKLGAEVDIEDDVLTIDPPEKLRPADIDTYDDHRMAMSFALAGTTSAGVRINDPACVNKTYPNFFEDLQRFYA